MDSLPSSSPNWRNQTLISEWTTTPLLGLCFVTTGIALNQISSGCVNGFAAVLLPQLEKPDSHIRVDNDSASWIASIVGFALLVGNFICPYIMDRYGRRFAYKIIAFPLTIGWFLVLTSSSVSAIIFGRVLQGISMGMQAPVASVTIGEYTSPKNRGVFLNTISLFLNFGILLSHVIGTFLSWQWTAFICTFFSFLAFIVISYSPETPTWYASKGRMDECREAFYWLRGYDEVELAELDAMINALTLELKLKEAEKLKPKVSFMNRLLASIRSMGKKEHYKPLLIMIHLYIMFQFAGINVIASYTIPILKKLFGDNINSYLGMILIDCFRLFASILACLFVKKLKRRTILYSSGLLCISGLLGLAAYLFLRDHGYIQTNQPFIPMIILGGYVFSLAFGIGPIPFTLAGEVFPSTFKSLGGGISVLFLSGMYFLVVKSAPFMFVWIGYHGTFVFYASVVSYCLAVIFVFLPETKDRTLQEIEDHFKGVRIRRVESAEDEMADITLIPEYRLSRRLSNTIY